MAIIIVGRPDTLRDVTGIISPKVDPPQPGRSPLRHHPVDLSELLAGEIGPGEPSLLQARYHGHQGLGGDCTEVIVMETEGSQRNVFLS